MPKNTLFETEALVVVKSYSGFRIVEIEGKTFVDFRDPKHSYLRNYISCSIEETEDFGHRYSLDFLSGRLDTFEHLENDPELIKYNIKELFNILRKDKAKHASAFNQRIKKGMVEAADLERLFPIGTEIIIEPKDTDSLGGILHSLKHKYSFFGSYFELKMEVIHANNGELTQGFYTFLFAGFEGQVPLDNLPIRKATSEDKKVLSSRGEKIVKFCKPGTYGSYQGNLVQPGYWSSRTFRADGRMVIDPISFERQDPEGWRDCIRASGIPNTEKAQVKKEPYKINAKDYWRCFPWLYGFSLSIKKWGQFKVCGLEEVQWRDNAWNKLVLDPEEKDILYSLVKFHGHGFTDIIEGKGGGAVILLHGKPGLGKTTSAEAVAEILHKPLYSVSIGELGTNPDSLENRLRDILDVAVIWNAVLLLDEADIFLEERDEHNIARNAMVGVFLRMLEYHNGVLFLTTNRVKKIDPAIHSRILIALHYKSDGKIPQIWHNLLEASGLEPKWAKELADQYSINGRQIKNAIRMAQTIALSKDRKVLIEDIKRALSLTVKFETELKTLAKPENFGQGLVKQANNRT